MSKETKKRANELSLIYNKLVRDIISELKNRIENSKTKSKFNDSKVVKVNVFDYTELGIINDTLTFFDKDGYHYSLFCDCDINDLVDILISLN